MRNRAFLTIRELKDCDPASACVSLLARGPQTPAPFRSFLPGAASTPETTSTPQAAAWQSLRPRSQDSVRPRQCGVERFSVLENSVLRAAAQSKATPVPPTAVAVRESTSTASTCGLRSCSAISCDHRSAASASKCTTRRIRSSGPKPLAQSCRQLRPSLEMQLHAGQSACPHRRVDLIHGASTNTPIFSTVAGRCGTIAAACAAVTGAGWAQTQTPPHPRRPSPPAARPQAKCCRKS